MIAQSNNTTLDAVLKKCRSAFVWVAFFSFVMNILALATPLYMLQVMDRVLRSGSTETLLLLTIMAMGAVLVMSLLDTLRNSIAMRTGTWFNEILGPEYLESGCRAQIRGDFSGPENLRDIGYLQGFIATQGMAAFFDFPWLPIFVVVIWQLHPDLGMIAAGSAVILFAISYLADWLTHEPSETADLTQIEIMRLSEATIRNAEVVQAMGMMPAMKARWHKLNDIATAATHKAGDISGHLLTISKFIRAAVQIAILGAGAYLVVKNEITAGAMIAAAILLGRALMPIEMAIGGWKGFVVARMSYRRLRKHAMAYPAPAPRMQQTISEGELVVENLTYTVAEGQYAILDDVSFSAQPGEVLAIVGPSGAGKSTLCRMLIGLVEPTFGEVRFAGTELRQWDAQQLGEVTGFLPQDVELFTGTVRENISRMRDASDQSVSEAASLAHVKSLIQRLPQSFDTLIGENGVRLSGGQRQRIGLARAVFGMPRLVVLDEPNANLDQAGESSLAEALKELKKRGCTVIVVGHRPSTLSQADKLLVLQDGSVSMFGDRDDVMTAWSEASAGDDKSIALRRAPPSPPELKLAARRVEEVDP